MSLRTLFLIVTFLLLGLYVGFGQRHYGAEPDQGPDMWFFVSDGGISVPLLKYPAKDGETYRYYMYKGDYESLFPDGSCSDCVAEGQFVGSNTTSGSIAYNPSRELFPGLVPISVNGIGTPLIQGGSREPGKTPQEFFDFYIGKQTAYRIYQVSSYTRSQTPFIQNMELVTDGNALQDGSIVVVYSAKDTNWKGGAVIGIVVDGKLAEPGLVSVKN